MGVKCLRYAIDKRGGLDDNEDRSCRRELGVSPTPVSCEQSFCDRGRDKSR